LKFIKEAFHAVGEFQSRLLLTVLYFVIIPVFAIIAMISGDPLSLRDKPSWLKRPQPDTDVESARRQF
jgi:hypothetical protein